MKISASLMNTWMSCPKKAHFQEILKLPEQRHAKTVFGVCIHEALELYNATGDIRLAIDHFKEIWDDPSLIDEEIDVWPPNTGWQELNQRGVESLLTFHDESKWEDRTILAHEHKFLVPFGEHTLSGIIDSLELAGKKGQAQELRVIDYKTSSYIPTHLQLRFNCQFSIYLYATTQREFWVDIEDGERLFSELSETKRRGIWYSIWHHKLVDVGPREELDLQRLYRVILEIEQAVKHEVYVPNISGESCLWCDYVDVCAATIPLAEEVHFARSQRIG